MKNIKNEYPTIVKQAKDKIPGFAESLLKFQIRATIDQRSSSLITNYSRSMALIALHFNCLPHEINIDDINSYLYRMIVINQYSKSYFKQMVFGLRHWFRLNNLEENALALPTIKHDKKLPTVLSKEECRILINAPDHFKHRFLLAFAYSSGLRMNELRQLKIADIDLNRKQIHIRQSKGNKDRYVVLSNLLTLKFQIYLKELNPKIYLFEGHTSSQPLAKTSIQYIIRKAISKTTIKKQVSMHTLRHSYATHLMEDGIDILSIQNLLGHADIRTTLVYLHIIRIRTKLPHSPLDSLFETTGEQQIIC